MFRLPTQIELGQHDLSNVALQQKGVEVVVESPIPAPMELIDTARNHVVPGRSVCSGCSVLSDER